MAVAISVLQLVVGISEAEKRSPSANLEDSFRFASKNALESRLLLPRHINHGDERAEDAVVNAVTDVPDVRYAVIEGLQTETGHERLVIAYPNEESLRNLIAAPSIVALGFVSRDEAVVGGEASFPNVVVEQRVSETMAGAETSNRRRH